MKRIIVAALVLTMAFPVFARGGRGGGGHGGGGRSHSYSSHSSSKGTSSKPTRASKAVASRSKTNGGSTQLHYHASKTPNPRTAQTAYQSRGSSSVGSQGQGTPQNAAPSAAQNAQPGLTAEELEFQRQFEARKRASAQKSREERKNIAEQQAQPQQ